MYVKTEPLFTKVQVSVIAVFLCVYSRYQYLPADWLVKLFYGFINYSLQTFISMEHYLMVCFAISRIKVTIS